MSTETEVVYYLSPFIPLSFKGEGEEILERGEAPLLPTLPLPLTNNKGRGLGGWVSKSLLATEVDRLIFLMIDCLIVKTGRKAIAMSSAFCRWERTKFIFTGRTEVRWGGFDMYVQPSKYI